jgi:hypothetical protein
VGVQSSTLSFSCIIGVLESKMLTEIDALEKLHKNGILPAEVVALIERQAKSKAPTAKLDHAMTHDVLVFLIDCSPSIGQRGLIDSVIDGQNAAIDTIAGADAGRSIMFAQYLFSEEISEIQPLINMRLANTQTLNDQVVKLNRGNYTIGNGTAIRDAVLRSLALFCPLAEAYHAEYQVYYKILIITDGEDVSSKVSSADCKKTLDLVRRLREPLLHEIILLGIGTYDYKKAGVDMGIHPDKILTCTDEPKSIRDAIDLASKRIIG